MGDTMVVMSRNRFEQETRGLGVGDIVTWDSPNWERPNKKLDQYLTAGDRLFIFTARPANKSQSEKLLLVTVFTDVFKKRRTWWANKQLTVPITDISKLRSKLRFHTGNKLSMVPGRLGNALQTPRMLCDKDIDLIEKEINRTGIKLPPGKFIPYQQEADEASKLTNKHNVYKRNPALARSRLEKDKYKCKHCNFNLKQLKKLPNNMSRILHIHHIKPLSKSGPRKTKLKELVTLCPTCHAIAHSLARALGKDDVELRLLTKYYPLI